MAKITDFDAGFVFSGKASGTKIRGYDAPTAYTPALDSQYSFNPTSGRDLVLWFLMEQLNGYFTYGSSICAGSFGSGGLVCTGSRSISGFSS